MSLHYTRSILAKQAVIDIANILPKNVWIQAITVEATPRTSMDETVLLPGFTQKILKLQMSYPSLYVPRQMISFPTPIESTEEAYDWNSFLEACAAADKLCLGYRYADSLKEHVDMPITERMFIKEVLIIEAQRSHPNYHDEKPGQKYNPSMRANDGAGDSFYDGVPCTRALFTGTHQLLGSAKEKLRDGFLDGSCIKPTHLVWMELVKTKHSEQTTAHTHMRAYTRVKKGRIEFDEQAILKRPSLARQLLPSCYKAGIATDYEVDGNWKNLPRFDVTSLKLLPFIEEETKKV
jgi:hypothetical protein